MSYGIKYYLNYCDENNISRRLEILEKGYSGVSFAVASADNPFTLEYSNEREDKLQEIQTAVATFNLYEDVNLNIDTLLNSDETKYLVKHYVNSELHASLFIIPDLYTSNIDGNSVINFTAIDRIASLKDVGLIYSEGKIPFISIITEILNSTGLNLNINILTSFVCSEWATVPGRSGNIFLDTYVFKERFFTSADQSISMYDALKAILNQFNCRLYQSSNEWWIVNKEDQQFESCIRQKVSSSGIFIMQDIYTFPVTTITNVDTNGFQQISPVHANVSVYAENGSPIQVIKNRRFEGYSSNNFPNWTKVGGYSVDQTNQEVTSYNSSGGISSSDTLETSVPRILQNTALSSNNELNYSLPYLESDPIRLPGTDNYAHFGISFRGVHNSSVFGMVVARVVRGSIIQYFSLNHDGEFTRLDTTKPTTKNFLTFEIKANAREGAVVTSSVVDATFEISGGIPSVSNADYTDVYVRIFGVKRPSAGLWQTTIKNIFMTFSTLNSSEIKGIIFQSKIPGDYTYKTDIPTSLFNDFVTMTRAQVGGVRMSNTTSISSIMYNSANALTKNWTFRASDPDYQLMLTTNQIARSHAESYYKLSISLKTQPYNLHSIKSICGLKYMILKSSYDFLRNECDLVLAKCLKDDIENSEFIYGYLGGDNDGINSVNSINTISSGGNNQGGGFQDLQSVTEKGNTTTLDITTRGTRNLDFLEIPSTAPLAEDIHAGKIYAWIGTGATAGVPVGGGALSTLSDVQLGTVLDGQMLAWSSSLGKWINVNPPSGGGSGTLTSVGLSAPVGFTVANTPLTSNGNLQLQFAAGYSLPTITKQTEWDVAYAQKHDHPNLSVLNGITTTKVANWDTAYGWGSHAGLYKTIGYVPTWSEITGKPTTLSGYGITDAMSTSHVANSITSGLIANWNTAYNDSLLSRGVFVDDVNASDNSRGTGLWSVETANGTGNTNFPDNSTYGTYWRLKSYSFTTDFFARNANDLFFKTFYHAGGGTGIDTPWRRIWSGQDFTSVNISNWNTAYANSHAPDTLQSVLVRNPVVEAGTSINFATGGDAWGIKYDTTYNGLNFVRFGQEDGVIFLKNSNNYVGIGTTNPTSKLHVSGVITASGGNSTNWNTAYGHSQATGNPHSTTFSQLLSKPTTLGGYGITDSFKVLRFVSDLNLITESGIYREESPSSGYSYTSTLNLSSSDGRQQLTIDRSGTGVKFRTSLSGSGDTGWSSWKRLWNDGDFTATHVYNWEIAYSHSQITGNPHATTLQQILNSGRVGDAMQITGSMRIPTVASTLTGAIWIADIA